MVEFTPRARKMLDNYLWQVRAYVRASKTAEPDDVHRDLTGHIEQELRDAPQPISARDLETVLRQLGDPNQWAPEVKLPWWQRLVMRMKSGPEDWRLAYLTFGLLILGVLFGWIFSHTFTLRNKLTIHYFNWTAFTFLVLPSFIAARAAVASVGSHKSLRAGEKWLLCPSLLVVYAFFLLLLLFWLPFLLSGISVEMGQFHWQPRWMPAMVKPSTALRDGFVAHRFMPSLFGYRYARMSIVAGAVGLWWTVLGGAAVLSHRIRLLIESIFHPFLAGLSRRCAVFLIVFGAVLLAVSGAAILIILIQAAP